VREGLRLSGSKAVPGAELYCGDDVHAFGTDWHFHEGWQIVAVTRGERQYRFNRGSVVARPGQLVVLPPRLIHKARCHPDRETSFRIVTIPEIRTATVAGRAAIASSEPQLVDAFLSVFPMLTRPHDTTTTLLIQARLEEILSACVSAKVESFSMVPPQIRKLETYMLSHLDRVLSLSHLSSLVGWDPSHLARMFSRHVGLSSIAFHTRARLMQARSLISDGRPLSETSASLRFSDQSHFGRHFRRVYDMTPGEYQQSVLGS
jgi:AraC-like DNA-binding protein